MIFFKNCQCFHLFVLGKMSQENVFYDILDRKNAFLDYKNMKLEKTKNWDFLKGLVHDFCQKMAIFSSFYFRQNRPGKCVLRYS